ncbi:cell wall metabolism sensor histidine kinase WalK [Microbacterium sp. cx-59]|uniref:sensor histidine kinase n=1 Tax=Microbacterium sp. cx-59 TaxID=2891207 RepID=UPI001E45FBE2|nr:HAMP domain-containing sensor histidine kinase [Microbacterium sp. cx-59]MCC4908835.1 HAMP domain-containing histidine kinase [Microbacterium sp. cx-59]
MVFLRTTLLANLDTTLTQLSRGPVANTLFDVTVDDGDVEFTEKDGAPSTEYFLAIYDAEGNPLISGGGDDGEEGPDYPESVRFDLAYATQLQVFELTNAAGTEFHATYVITPVSGTTQSFTQLVAIPTTQTERVVATYLGIYTLLALVTVIASAFLVRWVVTLTFRSLGQVERTAEAIAGGDFSQRMTDIEPETTEVGRLKRAINAMLGRVDASLSERDATVRQMRRFIGDASHELRTPLVTVRGYAELYRIGAIPDAEATGQAMGRIEKEAMRMTSMVEDLLALARLDERRDVVLSPIDLRPIARDAALDVSAAAPQRAITVLDAHSERDGTLQTPPVSMTALGAESSQKRRGSVPTAAIGLASRLRRRPRGETGEIAALPVTFEEVRATMPPVVLGDENRIRQVVANLLGNAQRFSAADSPIELRVGTDDAARTGWIEIIDHGEGVPEPIREQIFQRFWRADTSRARETGGSGLGLSIVASIVETLHGSVAVTDTPGGGATFRVSLPLAADREAAAHLLIETQPVEPLPSALRPTQGDDSDR